MTYATPEQYKVASKRYFSNLPFTNIHVMMGAGICETFSFVNHQLDTDHKLVQEYLDPLVDRSGSGIVSKSREQIEKDVDQATLDARALAEKHHARAVAAGLSTAQ